MIQIVVGTEESQHVPQKVLEYSIRKNTKAPLDIRFVFQEEERVGGTQFGFVRFHVPKIFGYQGKAIYLDADQLVFTDIEDLVRQLDEDHAVAVVQEPAGFFGSKPVQNGNQTSVMVLNCPQLTDWQPEVMFQNVVPNRAEITNGQIHYRDFMMLSWMDPSRIQALDPRWNHFNIINKDTRLAHFSHVRSQPWKDPRHPLKNEWGKRLRECVRAGFLKRRELFREIVKGHIHRSFFPYVWA